MEKNIFEILFLLQLFFYFLDLERKREKTKKEI